MSSAQLQVDVLSDADRQRWDRFVDAEPAATFFHRAGWARVMSEGLGHRPYFLHATVGAETVGVLPLVHVKSALFGNALISNAFCVYGGPVARDEVVLGALDRRACELADALKVDYVEYRSMQSRHADWSCKDDLYVTFRGPIDPDPDVNMKAIPRKQRAMVRKGLKNGLTHQVDQDVDTFFRLYATSVRNLGTPVFPKRLFTKLMAVFDDCCDVLTVRGPDGTPVSAVLSFYFRDQVLPYYGGGTVQARALAANDYMYWALMDEARQRGLKLFDFGRSKRDTGAFAFKKNWGFEPEPLYYEYHLVKAREVPEINPLNPKYRLLVATWKRLPLPVANALGPLIARNLG